MRRPRVPLGILELPKQHSSDRSLVGDRVAATAVSVAIVLPVVAPGVFDPSQGYPAVVPYVRYPDPAVAIEWLSRVLGARELLRLTLPDGRIGHAELALGAEMITVGLALGPIADRATPTRETLVAMTLVFVDDVDGAVDRALVSGGELVDPAVNQPWGLRQAIVADPAGHLWELSTHIARMAAEEWGAEIVGS